MHSLLRILLTIGVALGSAHAQDAILGGTIVTPDKVLLKAWMVIKNGRIDAIKEKLSAQESATAIDTEGIIFPGFIDLHNHPMYNVFPRWHPPMKFKDRYEWRDNSQYKELVGTPGGDLQRKDEQTFCDVDEYAEVRALIGGTTSIAGISERRGGSAPVPDCLVGLARNLDWASGFYGSTVGHERIENALGVTPRDMSQAEDERLIEKLAKKEIDLLLLHVGEGSPQDLESSLELLALKGRGLLGKHTAIIHGTALAPDDFGQLLDAGTALIWSPRSNMELYGVTTNIAAALRHGISIALAPDWAPTGSTNTLAELQYARELSRTQMFGLLPDRQLFEMATSIPARIASIDDKVGSIQQGLFADLFVIRGSASDPFATLAQSRPQDVQLVLVGGVPLYGSEKLMGNLKAAGEPINVCGSTMLLNSARLPAGKFQDVENRLKTDLKIFGIELAPLTECPQ